MPSKGDFARVLINGADITGDVMNIGYNHQFGANPTTPQNVGIDQFGVGVFDPKLTLAGLRKSGLGLLTAYNLLTQNQSGGVGAAYDPEYIVSLLLGNNAAPGPGDAAILMDATLLDFNDKPTPADLFKFNAVFGPRGLRGGFGKIIFDQPATTTGSLVSPILDRGAPAAAGTLKGGVVHLQVLTPSGTQATGTITFAPNAADGDTCTINGTAYRFKTTPVQAGDVQIGANSNATALNFFQALIGSQTGKGTAYFAGTTPIAPGVITISKPTANVISLTAVAYGTAGNAYTLAKTGTNITLSGSTFSGGTAGDSYAITLASATTSGGTYTTLLTFNSTMQALGAERQEIPIGTLINRYVKVTASTGGSTSKPALDVAGVFYYQ